MNPKRRLIVSGLIAAGPALAFAHPPSGDMTRLVTQGLSIAGRVRQPLNLAVDALREFPAQTPAEIPLVGRSGETLRVLTGYVGAKLTELLDKSGINAADHNDLKKTIVVATASDGYKAVFSWNELFNTAVGDGVLVLYERQGKALGDDEGRIALISTRDKRTGPRHVRWLRDIDVRLVS